MTDIKASIQTLKSAIETHTHLIIELINKNLADEIEHLVNKRYELISQFLALIPLAPSEAEWLHYAGSLEQQNQDLLKMLKVERDNIGRSLANVTDIKKYSEF